MNGSGDTIESSTMINQHGAREKRRYAGFWMRFWAYLADLLVVSGLSTLVTGPLNLLLDIQEVSIGFWSISGILAALVFYLYFLLMTRFFGQTLGKMIFGLRVVGTDGGQPAWLDLVFREIVGRFIYRVFFIMHLLYAVVGFTREKEGIHDMLGNTRVVYDRHR